jgi:hypothetical protein
LPDKYGVMDNQNMEIETLRNKQTISSIIGVILGAVIGILFPHPLIGVVVGVTIAGVIGNIVLWKDGARRGAITGLLVFLLAGPVILAPRIVSSGKTGFAFYDSFFFYLILGLLGSAVVGGIIGALISWLSKGLMTKNDSERDFLPNAKKR